MTYYAIIIRVNLLAGNHKVDDDSQKPFGQNSSMKSFEWTFVQLSFLSRLWNTFLANTFHNLSEERIILSPLVHDVDISPPPPPHLKFVLVLFDVNSFILGRNCKFRGYLLLLRDTVFFSALWDTSSLVRSRRKGKKKSSVEWSFFSSHVRGIRFFYSDERLRGMWFLFEYQSRSISSTDCIVPVIYFIILVISSIFIRIVV